MDTTGHARRLTGTGHTMPGVVVDESHNNCLKQSPGVTAQINPPDWTIPVYSLVYTLGIVW